jgi:1-acyl-sn-glycerol-3-phosphate acyltransferase
VRFKTGVAHLAAALGAEVVPFGLAGTEAVIPPHTAGHPTVAGIPLALRRRPLAIAFGAPLRPADGEAPQAFAARVERASYALAADAAAALARVAAAA